MGLTQLRRLLALVSSIAFSTLAFAYPDRPITLIVPFAAGGSSDLIARQVAGPIAKALGGTIIVEDRPGAGGTIGTAAVARAKPDGYTLLLSASGPSAIAPSIHRYLPYDPIKSFRPISMLTTQPAVIAVGTSTGIDSLKALIELAKASPGKLNFGSPGNGTSAHLAGEMFKSLTGTNITHVPYKVGQNALQDLMQDRIQVLFDNAGQFLPFVKAGSVRLLAVISDKRSPLLPDVPSTKEAGLPGFKYDVWFGISAPAGTPDSIVNLLNQKIVAAMHQPSLQQPLALLSAEARTMSPTAFQDFIAKDIQRWSLVIRAADLKPQ